MEGPYFLLSLYLLLSIARLTSCYPTRDSNNNNGGESGEPTCIQLDSALNYVDETYLFSNDVSIQLDKNYTEVNRYRIKDYWGDIEPVEAAMSFGYDAYFFEDTVNYHYSWFHGMDGPVENEDSWGEKTNGGVTAAASFDDEMAIFFYHCRYYVYVAGDGLDGPNSLSDIGLPCEVDAAFRLEGDSDDRIAVVKFDKMWYMAANESVEGPVDVNSLIKLKNGLTICSEEESSHSIQHVISKRSASGNKKYKTFWKKQNWKSMFGGNDSESESEEESESSEKRHEHQLIKLLNKLLDDRFGHGSENETSEQRYEREMRLAKLKAWVHHEISDEESNESDESYDSDSSGSRSKELEYFRRMSLKRSKRHIHGKYDGYKSESESEEQLREQAKEMFEQEMEQREEQLEQHKEQKHKHHGIFRREAHEDYTKIENRIPRGEQDGEKIEKELEQLGEERGQELGQLYEELGENGDENEEFSNVKSGQRSKRDVGGKSSSKDQSEKHMKQTQKHSNGREHQQDGKETHNSPADDCICSSGGDSPSESEEQRREGEAEKLQQRMESNKEWLDEKHEELENRLELLKEKGSK